MRAVTKGFNCNRDFLEPASQDIARGILLFSHLNIQTNIIMKVCSILIVTVLALYVTQAVPLPHQQGNDPFNSIARTFNEMATNTFSSAAAQQASHQQGMRPGAGHPVSASASAGRGHEYSSVHSSGGMWQHASASASGPVTASASASAHSHSSSNSNHQQKSRQSRPTNRPANRTGRPSRNRNSNRNANQM